MGEAEGQKKLILGSSILQPKRREGMTDRGGGMATRKETKGRDEGEEGGYRGGLGVTTIMCHCVHGSSWRADG